MNNTLNFNRLGKVIRRDGMNYIPNFGWSLVILWAIPLVIWLSAYSFASQGGEIFGRAYTIKLLMLLAIILAPAKIYKDCNDSRKGIQYAMLPASTLEKFISMFFYCVIVTPLLYMVGAVAIDTILTIIPGKNPYDGFIFKSLTFNNEEYRDMMNAMGLISIENSDGSLININLIVSRFEIFVAKLLEIISTASVFMFGNMIFKKRKTSKMIGILIVLFIVMMIFFVKWTINVDNTYRDLDGDSLIQFTRIIVYVVMAIDVIVSAVMLALTYHKIKTQKY